MSRLAERIGFTLVTVRTRPGELGIEDEDYLAAWDARVALGVVTWVTSTASRRADLGSIISHARVHGSLVAADITQAAGILSFDIVQYPVDFAASTRLKWMCSAPGPASALSHLVSTNTATAATGLVQPTGPVQLAYRPVQLGQGHAPLRQRHAVLFAVYCDLAGAAMAACNRHRAGPRAPRDEDRRGGTIVVELPEQWDATRVQRAHEDRTDLRP
jgi:hypothetical protein